MAVPLELPAFFFTDIPEVSWEEEEGGREGVREMECRERWLNYVAHLAKLCELKYNFGLEDLSETEW